MENFTATEQQLLQIIQTDFPLTSHPYKAIGKAIGISERETIERLGALKERKIIRQISAIFQSRFLGFSSVLVSFQIPEPQVETAASVISAHPGVSHNYLREHRMNIWFTLSIPQEFDSRQHVQKLAELTACSHSLYLPSVNMFKRRVQFDMGSPSKEHASTTLQSESPPKMSRENTLSLEIQKKIMQELQQDLPLSPAPFKDIAAKFQISKEELFDFISELKSSRKMSRFAGILRHRNLGFHANAMVVWDVPGPIVQVFAEAASASPAISHCYERATYPDWPYNMYTMLHSRSQEQCLDLIQNLATQFDVTKHESLYSVKEFKKQRVDYFSPEIGEWHKRWIG